VISILVTVAIIIAYIISVTVCYLTIRYLLRESFKYTILDRALNITLSMIPIFNLFIVTIIAILCADLSRFDKEAKW
jgi:hypothetical protein